MNGYRSPMTDPHDDVSGADAGSIDPDSLTEPGNDLAADLGYDGANQAEDEAGTADEAADEAAGSPAQGSPAGPPD
jgi:hypothetical protein